MLELILPNDGSLRRGECCVSISGKFGRILIFKEAYAEMKLRHGDDFEFVQFWIDRDRPDRFWIRPAAKENKGSARIVLNPKNGTRTISASQVLKILGWQSEKSIRCPLEWDADNNAAVVTIGAADR